jgi:hypothetical protein
MKTKFKSRNATSLSHKLSPQEFCATYLPPNWCERDLQMYCQRVIKNRQGMGIFAPPDEVNIPTPGTKKGRRADLATPLTVYEVKCWLDYDKIYHAVAQTELYARYGGKILWIIPKRRVVIGVAPTGVDEYRSAANLAKDFSSLRGVKVVFINEHPEWHLNSARQVEVNKILLGAVLFLSVVLGVAVITILLR